MNKTVLITIFFLAVISCSNDASMDMENGNTVSDADVYENLEQLNIELRSPTPPTANYVRSVRSGNLVFLAGHGPDKPDGSQVIGKVGESELSLQEAQEAARLTGISLLTSLEAEIGNLNNVVRIVKATGMVNAVPSFTQHSQVINGFSDLMVEVFGERGKHARAAVGMSSLPSNIAVEIEMIVEVSD